METEGCILGCRGERSLSDRTCTVASRILIRWWEGKKFVTFAYYLASYVKGP